MDPATRSRVGRHSIEIHPEFTLAFVEFDDQGRFWNREQVDLAEKTLEEENRRTDTSGVAVVVFAHGWRHNADVCDDNVACFRAFLTQAQSDAAAVARLSGGRVRPKRLVGVYVAWRGLSAKVQPFEDLSFWARKRVAQRIASGDLVELLTRIELFADRANAIDSNRARLAVLGHSLGGTMIYAALANTLKTRVLEALDRQDRPDPRASLIHGFGDLVVLINPALEASLYAPLHELAGRFRRFSRLQTPVLITIASETDGPNGVWFPLGRRFETLFESTGARSPRREIVTAIGNYQPFWTHRLTGPQPARPGKASIGAFGSVAARCVCKLPLEPLGDADASELIDLFGGKTPPTPAPEGLPIAYGRARLTRLPSVDPGNPFWVVRASDEVVHGHNGIFTTYLVDFVRRVLIEANSRSRGLAQRDGATGGRSQ